MAKAVLLLWWLGAQGFEFIAYTIYIVASCKIPKLYIVAVVTYLFCYIEHLMASLHAKNCVQM